MSKDFNKFFKKDIENMLKKDLEKKIDRFAKNMVGKVKNSIKQEVYSVYPNPKIYDRTYNLKKSISSNINSDSNKIIIDIYADDDIAKSHDMYDSKLPLEPYTEIVENGIGYDYNYPYPYNQPRPYMGKTFEQNEQFIIDEINKVVKMFIKK